MTAHGAGGRVDHRTLRVASKQPDTTGFSFSENANFGLGSVALLDVTHANTCVYYRTNWDCTGGSARAPVGIDEITISPGHTDLFVEEKRAVVIAGSARAIWPRTFEGAGPWRLLVAGATLRDSLVLAPGDATLERDVIACAEQLSDLTGRPVVVARQLQRHFWH